jgi:hypothetical protein
MVASVGLRGTPRKEPIFIPQNGPLSGARRTFEKRKRMRFRNQILEFVRGKNFQTEGKSTLRSLPKIRQRLTQRSKMVPRKSTVN